MKRHLSTFFAIIAACLLALSACNLNRGGTIPTAIPVPTTGATSTVPAADAPATNTAPLPTAVPATTAPAYLSMPAEPLTVVSKVSDEIYPATTGDDYSTNRYERPFQLDNTYRPDADIKFAFLADDGEWFYFSTEFVDVNPATKMADSPYGVEIDTDLDGRGDFLLWATPPYSSQWSKNNVQVRTDTNNDVGSTKPLLTDAPSKGDGYETVVYDSGKGADMDSAWVRQDPKDPTYLQIAVKQAVIGAKVFLWNPWLDFGLHDPTMFDYNDFFTAQEAGSPYAASPYFPLKSLYGMDNTCRAAYGFTPTGHEPGICNGVLPPPTVKPPTSQANPTNTPKSPTLPPPPPPVTPGSITGMVFFDNNANGFFDAGDEGKNLYQLTLYQNSTCSGSPYLGALPAPDGVYHLTNIPAGTWCMKLDYSGTPVQPGNPQTFTVSAGAATTVNWAIEPPG